MEAPIDEKSTPSRSDTVLRVFCAFTALDRTSFYALFSVLPFYLTSVEALSTGRTLLLLGTVGSLAALSELAGGFAADRVLGFGKAILWGTFISFLGYALLAVTELDLLYVALALIVVGNGLHKGNVPALLGRSYHNDSRRQRAFTYLYMAINVGALLGALAMGFLASAYGYTFAFAVAAFFKLLALLCVLAGRREFKTSEGPFGTHQSGPVWQAGVGTGCVLAAGLCVLLIARPELGGWTLFIIGGSVFVAYFQSVFREPAAQRHRLLIHLLILAFGVCFWTLYLQAGLSVLFYTKFDIARTFYDWQIPAPEFDALNPAGVLLFGPLLIGVWAYLARRRGPVDDFLKFALGLIITGSAFLMLSLSAYETPQNLLAPLIWILLFQAILAIGELCVSPAGMALTSALVPKRLAGFAMGLWGLAVAISFYIAGLLAQPLATDSPQSDAPRAAYVENFGLFGLAGVGAGLILVLLLPRLRGLIDAAQTQQRP